MRVTNAYLSYDKTEVRIDTGGFYSYHTCTNKDDLYLIAAKENEADCGQLTDIIKELKKASNVAK